MFPLRDENPSHTFPFVTIVLILANILVFLYEMSAGEAFINEMAVLPIEIVQNRNLYGSQAISPYLSLLTSMFLHAGWAHLIGNMWFLWIFGDNIEDSIGHFKFLIFYLATGVMAGLTHVVFNADSTIPTIGASGAISGVLGAYMVLHPKVRIKTLIALGFYFNVVHVPAIFFLAIWFLMQFLGGFQGGGGVAYGAHVGGFVAGVVLIFLFSPKRRGPPSTYYGLR